MQIGSGQYNHNLHHTMPCVLEALKIAQALAKDVGTDMDMAKINYAIKSINHCEVMYDEATKRSLDRFQAECASNGAD